jgi:hypothetical protein
LILGTLFSVCWFGGLAAFAWLLWRSGARDQQPYWILGGFGAAGLLPLAFVVREARLFSRYGRSFFEMNPVPGAPGGLLQGTVVIPGTLREPARVLATLTCWQRSEARRGLPHVIWQGEQLLDVLSGSGSARVPVRFAIPPGKPASQPEKRRGGVYWQLRLEGKDACKGLSTTFEVPVFVDLRLPAPSVALAPQPPLEPAGATPEPTQKPSASTIDVERRPGRMRFRFHYGFFGIAFTVLLPLFSPFLFPLVMEPGWALFWIVAVFAFALVTHVMEPMGIDVTPEAVILRRGLGGWFGRRRVAIQDVRRVVLDDCVNHLKQVKVETRDDMHSASRVIGVMEAEWLAGELRQAIAAAGGSNNPLNEP